MRIMSLDVGSQTIGVAVSDLFGWTAQGLETIRHTTREKDFERLRQLTDEYKVEEFVLGMPLNMNGTKGMRAERTEEFAAELAAAFPDIPYHFWDERLTTVMALAIITRCRCPPESSDGFAFSTSSGSSTRSSISRTRRFRSGPSYFP